MKADAPVTSAASQHHLGEQTLGNRFLVSVIAFHRAKQLKEGAAPRLDGDSHKATYLAVLEVLANTISWSTV